MRRALSYALSAALAATLLVPGVASAGQLKVNLCHLSWTGTFHLISVPDAAARNHVAHGDAAPGEAVPGSPGYIFGPACELVPSGVVLVRVTSTDAAGVVHLVAQVEDTDGNGTYGAGDTLRTGEFPYFAGDGTIAYAPAAVTRFALARSTGTVNSGDRRWEGWATEPACPDNPCLLFTIEDYSDGQGYSERPADSLLGSYLRDLPQQSTYASIVRPTSPSHPSLNAEDSVQRSGVADLLMIEWFGLP